MNQYDLLIADYLSEKKSVSFEKIGTLSFSDNTIEAEPAIPKGTLQFSYDKKAITDPGLIEYIAQRTNKNKGLILSDLESYIELMRQFINIGKPYEMEAVGVFKLAKSNEYEFTPYDFAASAEDQKGARKQYTAGSSSLVTKNKSNRSALMLLAMLIVMAILVVIGWGTYKLFTTRSSSDDGKDTLVSAVPFSDTVATTNTGGLIKDTTSLIRNDTADYKFIFENTVSEIRAHKRTEQLNNLGNVSGFDSLLTDTGRIYQLYLKLRLHYADTARAKDSIQKYLQKPIKISEIK
ncbi:MAG TPA: hypothetical protein PLP23_16810 [Panacibacter sp.]|nr:hypothetical protein [Panacibacter sp.]